MNWRNMEGYFIFSLVLGAFFVVWNIEAGWWGFVIGPLVIAAAVSLSMTVTYLMEYRK